MDWHMLQSWNDDPTPGSNLAKVNRLYPYEKVSDRARHYVSAGLEHLTMWADFAAPFKFHEEQTTTFSLRPTYALARAALESSAQTVWMLHTTDPIECLKRHLRLIRWDLSEYRKSRLEPADKAKVHQRDAELVHRVSPEFAADEILPVNSYLDVIRWACKPRDLDLQPDDTERVWRAMSGAAHGMYWTNLDLTNVEVGTEYEPGQFRTVTLPDASKMVEALQVAGKMTTYGTLKYLDYAGADIPRLMAEARQWLVHQVTLKPGADPNIVSRLAGDNCRAPDNSTPPSQS